jgi:hypothetical protein
MNEDKSKHLIRKIIGGVMIIIAFILILIGSTLFSDQQLPLIGIIAFISIGIGFAGGLLLASKSG